MPTHLDTPNASRSPTPGHPVLAHAVLTAKGADAESITHTCYLLHGILGSGRNWRSFARRLAQARPTWRFVLVDQRCHGDSDGFPPPHTLEACADDLARLVDHLGHRADVVSGHSFGGKVALTYADRHGDADLQTWVLDASPAPHDVQIRPDDPGVDDEADQHEVVKVIRSLRAIPLPLPSREAMAERMREMGYSDMLVGWMTTNLAKVPDGAEDGAGDGGYRWRFDLDGIEALMDSYFRADLWHVLENDALDVRVVMGGRSRIGTDDERARLDRLADAGLVDLATVDAGHWLHAEAPAALAEILTEWMNDA